MLGKLRDLMGLGPETDIYDEEYPQGTAGTLTPEPKVERLPTSRPTLSHDLDPSPSPSVATGSVPTGSAPSNVIGMPNAGRWWGAVAEVLVIQPRSFSEMPEVIKALKERKSVVLNLTLMEPEQAQRSVDFVAGATFTIDGHQERIGESIFLFTPSCVQVSTQVGGVRPTATPTPTPVAPPPAWGMNAQQQRSA
ncbi:MULTISPECIES: cell division protein SepF [unclassified Thermosynechococcus]|uniref:cell division protein SepF n=1 Tax=unclassified Thermosynechococcus TaxID=2622553 RepID=UPI0019DF47DC|nr:MULTISPECIES: cell division protein SepF [unclassified Thermosynechococcus]HIK35935.1 cell division protein SepF [Thermosynechococcus sp. M98_K2018_005]HIK48325.1 cell division protein SepF [Thermosynechococcus sp. M55_K2018_012]